MTFFSNSNPCKKGVTLIELIMAMVILALVSIPMAYMIGGQFQGMLAATDYTAAGNLARREMERLINLPYTHADLYPATAGTLTTSYADPVYPYDFTRTVTTVAGANGAERKDIVLTVKRRGASADLLTLYGSIAKDVTYGL